MSAVVSRRRNALKAILWFAIALLLCCGAGIALAFICCKYSNIPPEAPVYPNSLLIEQKSSGVGRRWPLLTSYYVVSASPEDVVIFYTERGFCEEATSHTDDRVVCQGKSEPFGEYFAYIDLTPVDGKTHYTLAIRWRGCDTTWELR